MINNPRGFPDVIASTESGRPLYRGEQRTLIKVAGSVFWYWQPGWWCSLTDPKDHEDQLVDDDNVVAERARREAEAMAGGEAFTPALIRAIRLRCKLSRREAGLVFGTGAKSFEKYERGLIRPSGPVRRLLMLAMSDAGFIQKRKAMLNEGGPDPKLVARTIEDARLGRTFGSVRDARGDARATGAEQQFRLRETARTKSGSSVEVARVRSGIRRKRAR
jgi:HTH-type transcriptional regulator / antitoxin MqsA